MNWKDLKLRRKFIVAFGSIILLLGVVAIFSTVGIKGIIQNAKTVIEGNKLRGEITQRELDHLNWVSNVSNFLNDDNITSLDVQMDHHLCAFGKWLESEERKHAEELVPELAALLSSIEEPHQHLHESAAKIKDEYKQGDIELTAKIQQTKTDHLIWAHKIKDVLVDGRQVSRIDVVKDPKQCKFGKWLYSPEIEKFRQENPEFDQYIQKIEVPHNRVHTSALTVESHFRNGNIQAGKNYYNSVTKPTTYEVLDVLDEIIAWNGAKLDGMQKARETFANETSVYLGEVQGILHNIVETTNRNVMTDDEMLRAANKTSTGVIVISLIIAILAIILAIVIARGIIVPINKSVVFASKLAEGDLTSSIDVDQKDEIGVLASSLNSMGQKLKSIIQEILSGADNIASASQQMSSTSQELSQGASEQASSVEEVSSSMEEMSANIDQNKMNSQGTETIALNAAKGIKKGSEASNTAVSGMKDIAEKIKIINDIAFQTNILALNAAVEAARAGEHGKGFAVVAAEVRKLAERSKVAADEIDELSRNGVQDAENAGVILAEIVPEIEKTANLIQEISSASNEQSAGAMQVNSAMQQLNNVTQQNAASSEELATSAEELASQAEQLKEAVMFFNIGESNKSASNGKPQKRNHPSLQEVKYQKLEEATGGNGVKIHMEEEMEF